MFDGKALIMKKIIIPQLLALTGLLCLGGCGSSSSLDSANTIGLSSGDGTYDIDTASSNKDGSLCYEIFVRSFYDSDGDGTGDFNGVASKASYLKSLGVGKVWLMPINPSPSYHGYDVSDYYAVNEDYGTMEDFENMVKTLNDNGIDVIMDMVLNHSATDNPWFIQSYKDFKSGNTASDSKKDWYNWYSSTTGTCSRYGTDNSAFYEAQFGYTMPDFNFSCQAVQDEFSKILNFWCAKGVSGFRLDAVLYYCYPNTTQNIEALNKIVSYVQEDYPDTYFVGECWSTSSDYYEYYKSDVDSFFDFNCATGGTNKNFYNTAKGIIDGDKFTAFIQKDISACKANNADGYPSFFISNHDMDRPSKSLEGNRAKLAASLAYLLPGTPYIYYGEEIGLKGIRGSNDESDVLRRLPMIWSQEDKTGECDFPEPAKSALAKNVTQVTKGADDLAEDPLSSVCHYQKLGSIRNKYSCFQEGSYKAIALGNEDIAAYEVSGDDEDIVIVHNLSDTAINLDISAYASSLLDSVNTVNLKPSFENGLLGIGAYSSAVLQAK